MKIKPIISIIIATYNSGNHLSTAIESIRNQNFESIELIIIDGGSIDETLNIIRQYKDTVTYWKSEPDSGIYEAMNKGIRHSNGEWLYFLGSDDMLKPNVLKKIATYLNKDFQLIYGLVEFNNAVHMRSTLGLRTIMQNTIHHQSAFYNRALFDNFKYDTSFKILSDYELNLLIYTKKLPARYINLTIATCDPSGASSNMNLSLLETNMIRGKFFAKSLNNVLSFFLFLYYKYKSIKKF